MPCCCENKGTAELLKTASEQCPQRVTVCLTRQGTGVSWYGEMLLEKLYFVLLKAFSCQACPASFPRFILLPLWFFCCPSWLASSYRSFCQCLNCFTAGFFVSLIRCQGSRVAFHDGTYVRYSACSFGHLQPLHLPPSPLAAVAAFSRSPRPTGAQRIACPWVWAHMAVISAITARADRHVRDAA